MRSELSLYTALGTGWMTDGDWLLQNAAQGAPAEKSTVNALTPMLTLRVDLIRAKMALGLGSDVYVPLGEYHTLPVGDVVLRARLYPHLSAGLPHARLTVGYLFPWHVGLGIRAGMDVAGLVDLSVSGVYGLGLPLGREDGSVFQPQDVLVCSLSVGTSF